MNNPIRVLQIVKHMNRGGVECRLMDIYRNIDRTKIQFDFYTCSNDKGFFDEEILRLGGKIYYNSSLSIKNLGKIPDLFYSFFTEHKEYKIAHCHLNQWCGLILMGAKRANVPVRIAHSRATSTSGTLKRYVKNIVKLPTNFTATHKFAVSKKAGLWLFGIKEVNKGNVTVWPNAIDSKKFAFYPEIRKEVRQELGLSSEITFIHVGNFVPEKNHKFLIDIFTELKKVIADAKLILIGGGDADEIKQKAKQCGVYNDILFLGRRDDVHRVLQAGDIFLFPSIREGFPGAVLEAQASGLPCIISDTITEEVCLTNEIFQLPIDRGTDLWTDKVRSMLEDGICHDSTNSLEAISAKGYDIKSLIKSLEEFYLNAI